MGAPAGPDHDPGAAREAASLSPPDPRRASRRTREPDNALGDVHLLDYVRVLYKRRWAVATVFLLVLLGAIVVTFTTTPMYEARTRLLIESGDPNIVAFKEVIDQAQSQSDYYQTQYNILQSRTLIRDTLDDLRLWDSPLINAERASGLRAVVLRLILIQESSHEASRHSRPRWPRSCSDRLGGAPSRAAVH